MASQERSTFSDVWDQLDPKYAERVRVTDASVVGDEEIVRRWPKIGEGYLSKCVRALSLFTDSKNTRPQMWVKDPVCGRETFYGTYRLVTVDVDTQKPGLRGIIQTLRKGWAQDADWLEARLVEGERGPANDVSDADAVPATDNPTRFLKVKFPNCDPAKVEAIAVSLGSIATYSNVVVQKAPYTGTWNTVWAATKLEEDGSGTVTLYLALAQYNLKSYESIGTEREQEIFYVYDCPKNEAQTIIDAWKAKYPVGAGATTNYSRSNGLVDLVLRRRISTTVAADFGRVGADCRYSESQTAIFGTSDDEAYPIPADGEIPAGTSYSRNVRGNGDGTYDVYLTVKEVKYRSIGAFAIERNALSSTDESQQLGVTDEEVASLTQEDGKIKRRDVSIKDDCSKDVVDRTTTVIAKDSGWIEYADRHGSSYYRTFRNQTKAWILANVVVDFTDSTQNSLSAHVNEAGLYDGAATRSAVGPGGGGLYSPPDDEDIEYTVTIDGRSYAVSIKITGSETAAKAHINEPMIGGSGLTPGIRYLGRGMWRATKVTGTVV